MALTYIAPNFNSDVDFDVADATAVKFSPPAAGDKFYVYSGATFTIEQNLACLQVILGRTSAGAAGAGNRYGLVVQNGGTKITFDGAAAITNSGIYAKPTSADASSKGCKVTISGTSASKAQWDVSVQWDTNYRFQLHMRYGYCDIDYLQILANTSYTSGVYQIVTYPHTTYAPEGVTFKINHAEFPHICGIAIYLGANTSGNRNLSFEAKYCIMDTYSNWMHIFLCDNCYGTISSGDIDFTGFTWISNSASSYNKIIFRTFIQKFPLYISNNRASFVNNLPTQVVPTTPDATDPGTNGDLTVTWANGASYAAGDKVVVYNNAGGAVLGILDATAGTGIITGLTNGVEYTMYLKATSDNYNFSDETATFTGTPTVGVLAPSIPTEISVVEGDAQLTATFKGQSGKTYYMRVWDATNGMTTQSETFKVTGNGATPVSIVYTGLANYKGYMIFIYGLDGGSFSDWVSTGATYIPTPTGYMNYEAIGNALRNRFKIQVSAPLSLSTQYDNAPPTKPTNTLDKYARLSIKYAEQKQTGLGDVKRYRISGIMYANIFVPITKGVEEGYVIADTVIMAFRTTDQGGIKYKTPSLDHVGRDEENWTLVVKCPFYADTFQS